MSRRSWPGKSGAARAKATPRPVAFRMRLGLLFGTLLLCGVGLVARAVQLQLVQHRFLAGEGAARFTRVAPIVAHRGAITDREGEPLAISTPVDAVWVNPQELAGSIEQLPHSAPSPDDSDANAIICTKHSR